MSETSSENKVYIKLGDIIDIEAPDDTALHDKRFLVIYTDTTQIKLVGDEEIILYIDDEGGFSNESIENITIISRSESGSYAIQNDLVTDTWIDIYFEGDIPLLVTGQITNLEKDQIEVKSVDGDTFYIDFEYKGIPLDPPIKSITIRNAPPTNLSSEEETTDDNVIARDETKDDETKDDETKDDETKDEEVVGREGEEEVSSPPEDDEEEDNFKEKITKLIMTADELKFGDDLDEISELVDLPESEQRYGIDKQTGDLLDELLASIPNIKRTPIVMNSIHMMIERFIQLRNEFSNFDDYNNATSPKKIGAEHKPLVDIMEELKQKLYWILPVVKNTKKLYITDESLKDTDEAFSDTTLLSFKEVIKEQSDIYNQFLDNSQTQSDNKYIDLQRKLDPYYKPYNDARNRNDILASVTVNVPITSVVNNMDGYKSTVFKKQNITVQSFLTQEHSLGQSILTQQVTKKSTKLIRSAIIPNDRLDITSLLTLQEPIVRFSRINLPSTDIVTRANLNTNFLSYGRLLRRRTNVNSDIINNNSEIQHDDERYLKSNNEYIPEEGTLSYREYLEKIIPKTRVLFNLIKSHISNNVSVHEILKYMEPFMVYQKDITFMQYNEFISFIKNKINEVKAKYDSNVRALSALKVKSLSYKSKILELLMRHNESIFKEVTEAYGIPTNNANLSDGEIFSMIEDYDGCELYNTAIGLSGISLIVPNGMSQIEEMKNIVKPEKENTSDCNKYVIAKKYIAIDELEADNDTDGVYYDKKYDPTYYELIKEYQSQLNEMENDNITGKIEYIAEKLRDTNGLSPEKANIEAKAIYFKKREVNEGDYAILDDLDGGGVRYYRRTGSLWELDDSIDDTQTTDDTKVFCNLNEKCISVADNCENMADGKLSIDKVNMKQILAEFDESLQKSSDVIINTIKTKYENCIDNMKDIRRLKETKRLKNNDKQLELGIVLEENIREKSPHETLRDTILGIGDLTDKQLYISKFVNKYTRPANDTEDEWWLYCIATDIKLLPTFIRKLSDAYLNSIDEYLSVMNEIAAEQGEKSDDEAFVVDKYSGYNIKPISFDTEEGFTEAGFKIKSRDILEADFNYSSQSGNNAMSFDSEEAEKVFRVANAMAKYIGIDLSLYSDFIIRNSVITIGKVMPSRAKYEVMQQNKKKPVTYEKALDSQIVMITLSYFILSIQTSIPSIKTRKRFPGCKKSFTGFPMGGEEDTGAIMYIACIARKIKSDQTPWSAIKKTKEENIVEKIKYMLTKYVLTIPESKKMMRQKIEYMKLNPDEEIPYSISVKKWTTFLPPLESVKTPTFQHTSKAFNEELSKNYKSGNKEQHAQINIIRSKIIYSALKIQEHIHSVVYAKTAILSNSLSEPFLENACCDSDNNITIDYFIKLAPEIANLNNYVVELQDRLDDMHSLKQANTLIFPTDTKLKYPEITTDYTTPTIYKAFIYHCKFGSNIPIGEEIRAICGEKPNNFVNSESIDDKIAKLKSEGVNYSNKNLTQLVNIINRQNIVGLEFGRPNFDNISTIRAILESANERGDTILPGPFIVNMLALTENYEPGVLMDDTPEMETMKNYLYTTNNLMEENIIDFITSNGKPGNKIVDCLRTINEFNIGDKSEDYENVIYKMMNYMKLTIKSICKLFPNMIKNRVGVQNIMPPTHWKLSAVHKKDFQNIISKYYGDTNQFYNDKSIEVILDKVYNSVHDIYQLSENTLYSAPVENGKDTFYSVFDKDIAMKLFKFYFYTILTEHVEILSRGDIKKELALVTREEDKIPEMDIIEGDEQDLDIEIEIIRGNENSVNEKIASLMNEYAKIICVHKNELNYTYELVMERVNRSKEKEKESITSYLRKMTDEQREIENHFKNHKLERWSVGLQKGVRIYQKDTYDKERQDMEKQIISDIQLGRNDVVNDMNRDIFELDAKYAEQEAENIDAEEYSMNNLADDDDHGDRDGDM